MANLHSRKTERSWQKRLPPSTLCHDCCWVLQLFKTLRVHAHACLLALQACVCEPCGQGFVKGLWRERRGGGSGGGGSGAVPERRPAV